MQEIVVSFPALALKAERAFVDFAGELAVLQSKKEKVKAVESLRERLKTGFLVNPDTLQAAFFLSVLCDLVVQGWVIRLRDKSVTLLPPLPERDQAIEKTRVRSAHSIERDRQLSSPQMRLFIQRMEETRLFGGQWVSIFSLMRDGSELVEAIKNTALDKPERQDHLSTVIDPYVVFVDATSTCPFTGLRLTDVWRYFRATWSSAYKSTPGRRMLMLVRDAAAKNHPIIGIAALSSAVVQSTVRDDWIGWTAVRIIADLRQSITTRNAKYLHRVLNDTIESIYTDDLIRDRVISKTRLRFPTGDAIDRLKEEARTCRSSHESHPDAAFHKKGSGTLKTRWVNQAESYLFRSKRAAFLASLLDARKTFRALGFAEPTKEGLETVLATRAGRQAIGTVVRAVKAKHVGINMVDITTCGSIAPYADLLGGKLVALLMFDPRIIREYARRYKRAASVIASGMEGKLVRRTPRLVLMGTTSLYGVSSSQYNRLRIPEHVAGAQFPVSFQLLGRSEGYGSFHFSDATLALGIKLTRNINDTQRVNWIFGEGVNPKLRQLREALATAGFPSDKLLQHQSPRLVYGVPLAANFRQVLMDRSRTPKYAFSLDLPSKVAAEISRYWRERWLENRVARSDVLARVASHTLRRPIKHGARPNLPAESDGLDGFRDTDDGA